MTDEREREGTKPVRTELSTLVDESERMPSATMVAAAIQPITGDQESRGSIETATSTPVAPTNREGLLSRLRQRAAKLTEEQKAAILRSR